MQALSQDVDESLFGPEQDELPPASVAQGNAGLDVKFYQRAVPNKMKSWGGVVHEQDAAGHVKEVKVEGAGRLVCDPVDFIRIRVPGDKTLVQDVPVRPDHKKRFPDLWRRYAAAKSENGTEASGTPLEHAPFLNVAQVEELRSQRIRTVEQLAAISDNVLQAMGMGARQLRDRAAAFLDAARGVAPSIQAQAELAQARQDNAALQARLAALEQMMARPEAADMEPVKPNRKSKA